MERPQRAPARLGCHRGNGNSHLALSDFVGKSRAESSHRTRLVVFRGAIKAFARVGNLEITPIVGLVHHGSGPRYTDLLDSCFPEKLAEHARAVATRYPLLEYYTPVNEPSTTARFSALYGHWFPHKCDGLSFARALINQVRGVMLAMQEIRRINPNAKLVQTEDMGRIYSTPALSYVAP